MHNTITKEGRLAVDGFSEEALPNPNNIHTPIEARAEAARVIQDNASLGVVLTTGDISWDSYAARDATPLTIEALTEAYLKLGEATVQPEEVQELAVEQALDNLCAFQFMDDITLLDIQDNCFIVQGCYVPLSTITRLYPSVGNQ